MRKLLFAFIFCCFSVAFAENIPVFTENKNAFVIDKNSFSKIPRDNIKIHASYNVKGDFDIFYYNENLNQWKNAGTINITKYFDTEELYSNEYILKKYRYFAVINNDNSFRYETSISHNDLNIYVYKDGDININGVSYNKGFYVINYRGLDVEDFIKIENCTQTSDFRVKTYVFNKRKQCWIDSGKCFLRRTGVETIKPNVSIDHYNLMAVVVDNGMKFTCDFYENHSDLYIKIISDKQENVVTESVDDIKTKLKNLKDCFESGLIDESEYREKRSDLLKNY